MGSWCRVVTAFGLWCIGSTAVAQDTGSEAEEQPPPDEPPAQVYEIEVISEQEVKRRRNDVERAVEDLGYQSDGWRRGYEVFLHPVPWKPEVWVGEHGTVRLKRRRVHFRLPEIGGGAWGWVPVRAMACVLAPTACVRVGGQVISERKLRAHKEDVLEKSHPQVVSWQDALATNATNELMDHLPTDLEALWEDGVHPETGAIVASPDERRAIILEMWLHKANNRWGRAVREVIGDFLRHVVQDSDHPVTAAELADVNARRRHGPALAL